MLLFNSDPVQRLVSRRSRYLAVFDRIIKRLENLHAKMHAEVEKAHLAISQREEEIQKVREKISESKNVIDILEKEKANTLKTKEKISGLFGGETS